MGEYVDREALMQELDAKLCALHGELDEKRIVYDAFTDGFEDCVGEVGKFQFAADVAPVVHGRWRYCGFLLECQSCGEVYSVHGANSGKSWNYCPNCGAKMDLEDGGGEDG